MWETEEVNDIEKAAVDLLEHKRDKQPRSRVDGDIVESDQPEDALYELGETVGLWMYNCTMIEKCP
jgi:hypothetical protein